MNVTLAVGGRFHAFDLAGQLARQGHLQRLITSYPAWKAAEWDIPRSAVRSILSHELIQRGWQRLPTGIRRGRTLQYWSSERFDRLAVSRLPQDMDLFVGFSSMSLHSLRRAKALGAVTVLERGSCHIQEQVAILRAAYDQYGLAPVLPDPAIVERELREYADADYISIPSSFVRRTFLARGVPEHKLIQVPYGVDLAHFRPGHKGDDTFRIIHCGALTLQKGVHLLLRAFQELDLPGAELWLIGAISEEIKPFLARHAHSGVRVLGTFPQAELARLYQQGSVFCLNSIQDGFGMVISQAMACGLPVVCTDHSAGKDAVTDGVEGYVIPAGDLEALKHRLRELNETPDRVHAMGRAAQERARASLTWELYGHRMIAEYARVLETARRPNYT